MAKKVYIHPYKGYLNTEFQIYSHEQTPVEYVVYSKDDGTEALKEKKKDVVEPNKPHSFRLSSPGSFVVQFSNGTISEITVEDAYKFGGNKHKKSFIFDKCPWAFIVMHDRTYFYNRESKESFVEAISPDDILEISKDYVLFKNEGQNDITLFSLQEQAPVLCVDNVIFSNDNLFVWKEGEDDDKLSIMKVYSLSENKMFMEEPFTRYSLDVNKGCIYLANNNNIRKLLLAEMPSLSEATSFKGQFVTFAQSHYAICREYTKIKVWDIETKEEQAEIIPSGNLARINDVTFIDIVSRRRAISKFDISGSEFPEAVINAQYSEYDIYPCPWRVFYFQKEILLSSEQKNNVTTRFICDNKKNIHREVQNDNGNVIFAGGAFCWYKNDESYVACRVYDHTSYYTDSKVYTFRNKVYLCDAKNIRTLSNNGFWDGCWKTEGEFVYDDFESYGIIFDKVSKAYYNHYGKELNGQKRWRQDCLEIGEYLYNKCGRSVHKKDCPQTISSGLNYGLTVDSDGVKFFEYRNNAFEYETILDGTYDTSAYSNVLLSDNGHQIMYREKNVSTILDIESGQRTEFENLSYINHINGIRPLFITESECTQARLINPLDGQPINVDLLTEYQFVSPDGSLYADKELRKYIEYRNKITGKTISKEDYLDLVNKFDVPNDKWGKWILSSKKEEVKEEIEEIFKLRDKFVEEHIGYFNELAKDARSTKVYLHNIARHQKFTDLFIKILGIAIIRRLATDEIVAKIELGNPLWFLNYVAFSQDSKYVAIAGRYPDGSGLGGLFLIYNLESQSVVLNETSLYAVWMAAFSKNGAVAAYTSNPITFLADSQADYPNASSTDHKIANHNFLTFSPDGEYFACSQQGYVPYRNREGDINPNWGHQYSSLVEIRSIEKPHEELMHFSDLAGASDSSRQRVLGIADTFRSQSVSSVSFSNDNKKLLMVGKDGVVIVRNLYLEDYACK